MDKIIENIKQLDLQSKELSLYIVKFLIQPKKYDSSILSDKNHMLEIYKDRLDYSIHIGNHFNGLKETVNNLEKYNSKEIRLTVVDGNKKSCYIFSSEDFSVIVGVIFYDNP